MESENRKKAQISLTIIYILAFIGWLFLLFIISDILNFLNIHNIFLYIIGIISWGIFIKLGINIGDWTNKLETELKSNQEKLNK